MASFTLESSSTQTEADRAAADHLAANLAALGRTQPRVVEALASVETDLAWVYGRDGYLTGFEPNERWYAGCSVPLLAARTVLKTFDPATGVACFLNPGHAGQIRIVIDQLSGDQALIAVIPDLCALAIALHCDNFSKCIFAGRLWFAWGEKWQTELAQLLEETPGLSTPTRFVRIPHADGSVIERMIADAQQVFGKIGSVRSATIAQLRDGWKSRARAAEIRNVCVIARSMFRLWDDVGDALFRAIGKSDSQYFRWSRFDSDDPVGSSPLTLAQAAAESEAIIAADFSRADAPQLVAEELPWITWITSSRIPAFQTAGPQDALLLADSSWRDDAVAAGWPMNRVEVATWPQHAQNASPPPSVAALALIADTNSLDAPESLAEFSSHGLLWETIKRDLLRDPLSLPENVEAWLHERARACGIAPATLNSALFVNRLILPAYQQGLADALIAAGLPLKLYGKGWGELVRFETHAATEITSREQLRGAAGDASALLMAWPGARVHPIDALGRPVVRPSGLRLENFIRDARLALNHSSVTSPIAMNAPEISASSIDTLIRRMEAVRSKS